MTDQLAGQPQDDASADAPAAPTQADIEKIKAELQAAFDARISGFQSKVVAPRDEMIAALRSELDQLKTAGLSEEEREQLEIEKIRQENQRLQAQLELKELSGQYGTEMPFFERLLNAGSAEDQLKVMREFAQTLQTTAQPAAPAAPAALAEADIPDVDPNRPARTTMAGTPLPDGTVMTDALADRILGAMSAPLATVTQQRLRPTL